MDKTALTVDFLFWGILVILLLTAIGTIVAGAVFLRDSAQATSIEQGQPESVSSSQYHITGALLVTLGSLSIFVAIAAGVAHVAQTWKRGNWVRSISDSVRGIPKAARAKATAFFQKKRDNRFRQLLRAQCASKSTPGCKETLQILQDYPDVTIEGFQNLLQTVNDPQVQELLQGTASKAATEAQQFAEKETPSIEEIARAGTTADRQ